MWEKIDSETDRMNVPDGWIVRTKFYSMNGVSVHHIFVADKNHVWKLR